MLILNGTYTNTEEIMIYKYKCDDFLTLEQSNPSCLKPLMYIFILLRRWNDLSYFVRTSLLSPLCRPLTYDSDSTSIVVMIYSQW